MRYVIALELKSRGTPFAYLVQYPADVLKGIAKDALFRSFDLRLFPIVFPIKFIRKWVK